MGARARALRRSRRLTLDALAAASGVSRSMISEIERGGRAPTVLVLDRIATALGTSIARLTQDESRSEPVPLARADQAVLVDPAGWERRILSPVLPGVEFEFMRTTLGPRVDAGTGRTRRAAASTWPSSGARWSWPWTARRAAWPRATASSTPATAATGSPTRPPSPACTTWPWTWRASTARPAPDDRR
jgi:transcriptional regulator with XRE-family HTH domain